MAKKAKLSKVDPVDTPQDMMMDKQEMAAMPNQKPMIPASPQMLKSIKNSRRGQLPPGLAKYMAAKSKKK